MAHQRGTSGRRVGSNGGLGAVGVTSRGEPGAGVEGEQEVEAVVGAETEPVWLPKVIDFVQFDLCCRAAGM